MDLESLIVPMVRAALSAVGVSAEVAAFVLALLPIVGALLTALDPWTSKRWPRLAAGLRAAFPHVAAVLAAALAKPLPPPPPKDEL